MQILKLRKQTGYASAPEMFRLMLLIFTVGLMIQITTL